MEITSSRKPSASTRTLCKLLASFFNCEYFNRGKMGMGEVLSHADGSSLVIVGEYHGNPGSINVYNPEGFCVLSMYISLAASDNPYPRSRQAGYSISGEGELAPVFSTLLRPDRMKEAGHLKMMVSDEKIDFLEKDITLFTLRIKSHRLYDGDENCN